MKSSYLQVEIILKYDGSQQSELQFEVALLYPPKLDFALIPLLNPVRSKVKFRLIYRGDFSVLF